MRIKLAGGRVLASSLDLLKTSKQNRIIRKATEKATTPLGKTVKRFAPRQSGLLRRSLGRKTVTYAKRGIIFVIVGAKMGMKQTVSFRVKRRGRVVRQLRNPAKYSHLVEGGTINNVKGRHFIRRAWALHINQVNRDLEEYILEGLARELRKA